MADIFCQFRHFFGNGIYCNTSYDTCTIYVEVSIVFTTFRHGSNCVGGHPHKEFLRFFRPQAFYQIVGEFIHINKRNIQLLCYIARRIQICSVRINQFVSFHHILFLRSVLFGIRIDSLANIILKNSFRYGFIIGRTKVTAHNGVEQNRNTAFRTSLINELTQVGIKGCSRVCMAVGFGLFVIVPELNKNIITFLYQ